METQKNLFGPIKSERTFEKVSRKIKRLIFNGVLKPGDRLPSELDLAQQFGVSRQTIREALRILELSGFINIQKGGTGGPLIKDTVLHSLNGLFLDAFQLEKVTAEELTIARFEIEKTVLLHAIDYADESDIKALQQNIIKARMKLDSRIISTDENVEFHNLLARASKNHVFVMVVGAIMAVVRDLTSRLISGVEGAEDHIGDHEEILKSKNAVIDHEAILNAVIIKNRQEAIHLMERHLKELGDRLMALRNNPLKNTGR